MKVELHDFWRKYVHHFRETFFLSIPVIIGQLGFMLMGFIDNLMIGDVGYIHLSAASLANSMFFFILVLGIGIVMAITPLVAEVHAAGDNKKVGDFFRQGSWVGLIVGIILGGLTFFSAELLPYLNQPPEDVALAKSYLQIISFSVLPLMLFRAGKSFAEGASLTRPAMYVVLAGLVFNVLANWLLIYGNWGFPRLELDGAGYGTLASRIFMMILMGAYLFTSKDFKAFRLLDGWHKWQTKVMRKILEIGLPSGLQYFFEVGAFVGASVIIGTMDDGSVQRAAHQIAIQYGALAYMVVSGLAAGSTIRVGNALGRKDFVSVRRAGMAGIGLGAAFMLVSAIIFLFGRNILPALFAEDTRVLEIASVLMIFASAFQLFDGIQAVGLGILRGIQDVVVPTWIALGSYWGISIPLGCLLAFPLELGVVGMWYGFVVALVVASILLTARFWKLTGEMIEKHQKVDNLAVML
ncbi:MAG: MATE family efflux transporter [Bacteroidota bacterium]